MCNSDKTYRECCVGIYGNIVNISWKNVTYNEKINFIMMELPL